MTRDSAKNIGLKAALRIHSRESKYFGNHYDTDDTFAEIIRIMDETERDHPSTIAAFQRRRQRHWLKASILFGVIVILIVLTAWWWLL